MILQYEKIFLDKTSCLKGKKILVALSGGKDSVVLLYLLKKFKDEIGLEGVLACHINHNLRENSSRDEEFCKAYCKELKIDFYSESVDVYSLVKKEHLSIEEAARKLRYEKLYEKLFQLNYDYLATAHHRDDLIENFFVRIFRGTPLYNLGGFNNEFKIVRPLMDFTRDDIDYLIKSYKLSYVVDETNDDERFLRNWIRKRIVKEIGKYNRGFFRNILRLIDESRDLKEYLDEKTKIEVKSDRFLLFFKKEDFLKMAEYERKVFLMNFLMKYFKVGKKHIEDIVSLFNYKDSKRVNLPQGYVFEKSITNCYLFKKEYLTNFIYEKKEGERYVMIDHLGKKIIFSGELLDKKLIVRNRKPGDRYMGKKLKDIFIDKKIDLVIRDTALIVESDREIFWIEGLTDNKEIKVERVLL